MIISQHRDAVKQKIAVPDPSAGADTGSVFLFFVSELHTLISGCLCAAQIFDVPITLSTYILFIFTVYVVTVATPPVPGGALATFTLLMTQLGIPSAAIAFIIALDPIIDRINTGTYITGLQMELVDISSSLDLLDKEKLRADK